MFRLGESIRRCGIALLLLLSLCPLQKAHAVIGTLDSVPAATLLYPYFEVDLGNANGRTTIVGLHNTSATAILGRVTVWSNTGLPIYNFNIYLTGYDAASFNMRDVLNGTLPLSASAGQDPTDTRSPKGPLSQDINFASCTGQLPYPTVSASFVADMQAMLTGKASTLEFPGQCVGTNAGDNVARGYLTIDTVNSCSAGGVPVGAGGAAATLAQYFDSNFQMTGQNVLLGDWMLVDPSLHVLRMNNATSIEASFVSPLTTTPGNYTFYGRFVNWLASDRREPLPAEWAVQGDTGNSSALIWRDPKVSNPAPFSCATGQPAYAPLGQQGGCSGGSGVGMCFFDRAGLYTVIPTPPTVADPFPPPLPNFAPIATQIVPLNSTTMLLPPVKMGWIDLDLDTTVAAAGSNPPSDPTSAQSLVVVLNANENQPNFSSGVVATAKRPVPIQPYATLEITTNNQLADNTAQDVAVVTLRGQFDNPSSGVTVTFTVGAGATFSNNTTTQTCSTNSSGQCSLGIKSAAAGSYAVNVTTPIAAGPQTVIFTGPPSAGNSSLAITNNNQPANGTAQDMAQVTLRDASFTPINNILVTFSVAAGATLVNTTCTTDVNGQCAVGIKSSTPGNYAVNVTAPVAVGPQNATFAGPPIVGNSTLAIVNNNQLANGTSQDFAQVTLQDAANVPVINTNVTFTVAAGATLVSNNCTTDVNGQCFVRITSTTGGSYAVNVTAPIALGPQNATFAGPPVAGNSTLAITTNNQQGNNSGQDVAQVTLHDAANVPVRSTSVTFTVAAGATLSGSSCFTNSNGQCQVGIRSSTPGSYAVNVTAPVALGPQNATFAGAPAAGNSTLAITTNNQLANGTAQDVAQVTLHDAANGPAAGIGVSFTVAAGASLVSSFCFTDVNGQCTVGITSSAAGSYAVNVTSPIAVGPQNATFN